ncbi:hypothetical protein PENTCL1PPCAC_21193 [Pristionchus entomophagus]|uniref:Kinase n=1 Tax=Pristionchus entomophagus TaxID=358040 RepID=A0AAV5TY63_9BILA|nr:hypothetical protein PENTCL1PPCAC_21193 [Pristionchus entomophagus]
MMKTEIPPGKVSHIASRVIQSIIDTHHRHLDHHREERTSDMPVQTEHIDVILPHYPPPTTELSYIDQGSAEKITEYDFPTPSTSEPSSQSRSRSSTLSFFLKKRPDIPPIVLITDPMGAVNSRERRTSSIGCWSTKSAPEDANDHYGAQLDKPPKLKLDVNVLEHRCGHELATPTSDNECNHPPLATSSNDRLLQIIRCFPFPTPRPSPSSSPRLQRKKNGSVESKNGVRKAVAEPKERRSRSVDEKQQCSTICDTRGYRHVMGQLVQVSVETMAITALPKESIDTWLKERLKKWIQLSGHEGSIIPASCNSLYKKQSGLCTEGHAYEAIQNDPALCGFAPKFYQQMEKNEEMFIEIEDLLSNFADPAQTGIMDIKIGTRTFLESEVSNAKMRKDLYEKMVAIDPSEATEEEKVRGEITKLRYMQFRERESSSAALGFRIEAAKMPGGELQKNFKKVRTEEDVAGVFSKFFGSERERVARDLTRRLVALRDAIERSTFFAEHEVVGSSLLVLFDKDQCGVWMIDFAKAVKAPCGRKLTHRDEWAPGNGEDGYLTGIDHLVNVLRTLNEEDEARTRCIR